MKNTLYATILATGLLWQPFSAQAQQNENADISRLRGQVRELEERNAFLKKALDLRASSLERTVDDMHIRLTHFYMDPEEKNIHLRGMFTYTGRDGGTIRLARAEIVDAQGNLYEAGGICHPNSGERFGVDQPEPNLPYAFSVTFERVNDKIPEAALLRIIADTGLFGETYIFGFKSVRVGWTKDEAAIASKTTEVAQ